MRVKYIGKHDAVEVPALGLSVKAGEIVDLKTGDAQALCEQETNWQPVAAAKTKES